MGRVYDSLPMLLLPACHSTIFATFFTRRGAQNFDDLYKSVDTTALLYSRLNITVKCGARLLRGWTYTTQGISDLSVGQCVLLLARKMA